MGSKRERKQVPPTKIVVRKLPTTFTEEEFKNAISPIPENNYFTFVPADRGLGPNAYSRAYINFLNPEEILSFRDRFDGYVFVDQKGNEFPALVEYAPFQKIPKSSHNKKDIRCGTIDEDPDYVVFLNSVQNPEVVTLPPIETLLEEIENIEKEARANNGVLKIKTPLLEYVEQRNAERFRPGDRKRRKEYDRKKAREEEKRRRKDIKEYRKKEDYYNRDERDKERLKRREEEKIKWKEKKKEEREKAMKREKNDRYRSEEKYKNKDWSTSDRKQTDEGGNADEVPGPKTPVAGKEDKGKVVTPRTKRYSEGRKKEEEKKKQREEANDQTEEKKKIEEKETKPSENLSEGKKEKKNEEVKEEEEEEEEEPLDTKNEEHQAEKEVKVEKEVISKEDKSEDLEDGEEKMGKDPRTERRIRNKDRPSMQLYRPGQARLKTRLKPEDGGNERTNEGDSSSSSSASPVMGVSEEKDKKPEPETKVPSKGYMGRGTYERKSHKYRDSRSGYYWDDRDRSGSYKDDYEGRGTGRGGSRKGYSYHQERENKGKWTSSSGGRNRDNESSQFKSMTFRRSTSQE